MFSQNTVLVVWSVRFSFCTTAAPVPMSRSRNAKLVATVAMASKPYSEGGSNLDRMVREMSCKMILEACDSVSHRALDIADIRWWFFLR
ncbi:hypothetical protein RCH14_004275 [Massilia sp. MP_M2]